MASEKKPSIYSDRSNIGSAEELDQYGVWVKIEPQDLPSSGASADDFEPLALPENGEVPPFDVGFVEEDGINALSIPDLPDLPETAADESAGFEGLSIPEDTLPPEIEPFESGAFENEAPATDSGQRGASEELSTKLLMKIADELSSIKTELSTLKKEVANIRAEAGDDEHHGGFFAEEDDEKIALTGDEMDNILNTTELEIGEAPEAADAGIADGELPQMAIGESAGEEAGGVDEEIEIDLNDLGINLDDLDAAEDNAEPAAAAIEELDASLDADFNIDLPGEDELAAAASLLDSAAPVDSEEELAELEPFDENDELRNIRLEGVEPLTAPPEDASYLEEDPFAAVAEDASLAETPSEPAFDLSVTESADGDGVVPADGFGGSPFDTASLDLSGAVIDEPDLSTGLSENPVQEPVLDDIALDDDFSIELEEEEQLENPTEGDAVSASVEELAVIPEAFEKTTEEILVPFDDELDPLADEDGSGETPLAGSVSEADFSLDEKNAPGGEFSGIPSGVKKELKNVLSYMDHLLESLPEEKIEEFAKSRHFGTYKKLFKELGLV